ncbi:helix-turn-helix domain-containing protein [Streptomyces sp. NPDC012888]|uniref:helix-turn-helix domain-containing protein n=1 Tax=Streptomyces sp. NPDC012888 TaxID=3364855 RepID=UPI0036763E41
MTLPASMFGTELRKRREHSKISLRRFATQINYSPGWISRVETGQALPTDDFARICDDALRANGQLIALAQADQPRSIILTPAQLPTATARFAGRSQALDQLHALSDSAPQDAALTIAIDGPAGAGKTALAVQYAHHVAAHYPGGVLYTDLQGWGLTDEPLDPGHVLERHLVAFGVPAESIPPAIEERAALLRTVVAGRQVLMVLDNARDAAQVRPLLPGSPGCTALITSRRRLTGLAVSAGAHRVEVGPMAPGESVALLRTAIGQLRSDAEPAALEALAERCGHLPLALRIAAETLSLRPHRTIAAAVADLAGQGRLDALAADDDPSLAIRTVLTCSYRALDPEVARALRYLGIHPGRVIHPATAAELLDRPPAVTERLLDALVATHLLEETGPSEYQLHDLVRDYAAERAAAEETADERRKAIRRLATWFMYSVDAACYALAPQRPIELLENPPQDALTFKTADDARQWCDSVEDLVVPLVKAAAEQGLTAAWQIPARLWNWLLLRKPWTLWIASHEAGLAAATSAGDVQGQAWVAMNLGEAYRQSGHFALARQHVLESLTIRRSLGDVHGQAWAETCLGFTATDEADYETAVAHFRRGCDLFAEVGDEHGRYVVMASLAEASGYLGAPDADQLFETALDLTEQRGDRYAAGTLWARRAGVQQSNGRLDAALQCLDQSITYRRDADDEWGIADALDRRGQILSDLGRSDEACRSWEEARSAFERLGDPRATYLADRLSSR